MIPVLYQHTARDKPALRVGILLDSTRLPRCFAEVIDHLLGCNFARIELLVLNEAAFVSQASEPQTQSKLRTVSRLIASRERRRLFLFALYQRWDRRHVDPTVDPEEEVDCADKLQGVDSIAVTPVTKRYVHRFTSDAIAQIRERNLDVLIRFGFNILRGDILSAARYGVWSYHHGDGDYYRGGPSHLWEIIEGNPLSGVMLQVLTEDLDAGMVLCKGWFATQPGLSRARNCVQPYWGASTFMIQKLRELYDHGWERLRHRMLPATPYRGRKSIYRAPTNAEMVRWLAPVVGRKLVRRVVHRASIEHWRLAVRRADRLISDGGTPPDTAGFRWIESPRGRFYADPFLVHVEGRTWLFFEDFDYGKSRGMIACAELTSDGVPGARVPVLERPYHLSYPCVFPKGDHIFMIPETCANGTVELYRCLEFPHRWRLERVLLELPAVDTTIWIEDQKIWLFVTLQEPRGHGLQLWLFSAEDLSGPFSPHPASPISTDVRASRGAGAIFRRADKLIRPSQDCSGHYGRRFMLNEIVELDSERYVERPCVTVDPTWASGLVGTHSYSHLGQIEVIDGCARLPVSRVL